MTKDFTDCKASLKVCYRSLFQAINTDPRPNSTMLIEGAEQVLQNLEKIYMAVVSAENEDWIYSEDETQADN